MAIKSYPFDNVEYLAEDAQLFHATRTNGVFSSDNHYEVTAGTGMQVIVGTGIAWMKLSEFGGAVAGNTTSSTLAISTAPTTFPRIDRVVIRHDYVLNTTLLAVKVGTPGSSPVAPAITRDASMFEMAIADVRVNAGALSIINGNIIDQRLNESVCGIMRDGVTGIPTQTLYDAWYSWFNSLKLSAESQAKEFLAWIELFKTTSENTFKTWYDAFISSNSDLFVTWYNAFKSNSETAFNTWFEALKNTLDENQATNLFNMIDAHIKTSINTGDEGVHNLRLKDGKFQVLIVGLGWATLGTVPYGFTGEFFNAQAFTGASFNAAAFTGQTFNNVIRVEV